MKPCTAGPYHMPFGLRFAFFKFHVHNLYLTWYYRRRAVQR